MTNLACLVRLSIFAAFDSFSHSNNKSEIPFDEKSRKKWESCTWHWSFVSPKANVYYFHNHHLWMISRETIYISNENKRFISSLFRFTSKNPRQKMLLKLAVLLLVALFASVDAERRRKRQKPQGCSFDGKRKAQKVCSPFWKIKTPSCKEGF